MFSNALFTPVSHNYPTMFHNEKWWYCKQPIQVQNDYLKMPCVRIYGHTTKVYEPW